MNDLVATLRTAAAAGEQWAQRRLAHEWEVTDRTDIECCGDLDQPGMRRTHSHHAPGELLESSRWLIHCATDGHRLSALAVAAEGLADNAEHARELLRVAYGDGRPESGDFAMTAGDVCEAALRLADDARARGGDPEPWFRRAGTHEGWVSSEVRGTWHEAMAQYAAWLGETGRPGQSRACLRRMLLSTDPEPAAADQLTRQRFARAPEAREFRAAARRERARGDALRHLLGAAHPDDDVEAMLRQLGANTTLRAGDRPLVAAVAGRAGLPGSATLLARAVGAEEPSPTASVALGLVRWLAAEVTAVCAERAGLADAARSARAHAGGPFDADTAAGVIEQVRTGPLTALFSRWQDLPAHRRPAGAGVGPCFDVFRRLGLGPHPDAAGVLPPELLNRFSPLASAPAVLLRGTTLWVRCWLELPESADIDTLDMASFDADDHPAWVGEAHPHLASGWPRLWRDASRVAQTALAIAATIEEAEGRADAARTFVALLHPSLRMLPSTAVTP